jgi:isoleucyl-tRNA synthetase
MEINDQPVQVELTDIEIATEDIPGWVVANQGSLTVALDITVTPTLQEEGIARELINRIQNLRKDKGFEVTDKITLRVEKNPLIESAIANNLVYICSETLAEKLTLENLENCPEKDIVELTDEISISIVVTKAV